MCHRVIPYLVACTGHSSPSLPATRDSPRNGKEGCRQPEAIEHWDRVFQLADQTVVEGQGESRPLSCRPELERRVDCSGVGLYGSRPHPWSLTPVSVRALDNGNNAVAAGRNELSVMRQLSIRGSRNSETYQCCVSRPQWRQTSRSMVITHQAERIHRHDDRKTAPEPSRRTRKSQASGEGGIRTLDGRNRPYRFSRPAHSTALPPLRWKAVRG